MADEDRIKSPEEMARIMKELEEYERGLQQTREREKLEDRRYEDREQAKLRRELQRAEQRRDPMVESPTSTKQQERAKIEKALTEKPKSQPAPAPKPKKEKLEVSRDIRTPMEPKKKDEEGERKKREKAIKPHLEKAERTYNRLYKKLKKRVEQNDTKDAREIEGQLRKLDEDIKIMHRWREMAQKDLPQHLRKIVFPYVPTAEEQRLLADPTLVKQEPEGGWKCINHPDRPAALMLQHNEVLEKGAPDVPLCENCAMGIRTIPLSDSELIQKRFSMTVILPQLVKTAEQLDQKGLYEEANIVDNIIKNITQG